MTKFVVINESCGQEMISLYEGSRRLPLCGFTDNLLELFMVGMDQLREGGEDTYQRLQ